MTTSTTGGSRAARGPLALAVGLQTRLTVATAPRASGLPAAWVLLWFPIVVVLGTVVLVVLGVSGSSTGVWWQSFGQGADPDLLAGTPRGIRSDEWLVQSSWIVSQSQQGFPAVNGTLPGGMDATIQNDLPSWDWSSLFRPHVLGFLLLPLEQGMAVRWWLPMTFLLVAAYAFVVVVAPRRPLTAAALVSALALSPMIQWWFLPTTILPVAWAFAVLTAVVVLLRTRRRVVRWGAAAAAGYLSVTVAMSIYIPYLVPPAVVVVGVTLGLLVAELRSPRRLRDVLRALLPLVAAAIGAVVVLGAWVATRLGTVEAVLGTVYPGQRVERTGTQGELGLSALFSGPFQRALQGDVTGIFAPNASESSAPLLLSLFLVVPAVWSIVRSRRSARGLDWPLVAAVVLVGVFLAFLFVPGWDAVAHLLFLDRTTAARSKLAFDVLNVVFVALLARRRDEDGDRSPWPVALLAGALASAAVLAIWWQLRGEESPVLGTSGAWRLVAVLLVVAVVAVSRRWLLVGTASFLAASFVVGAAVNPVYRGVFDLTETDAGRQVQEIRRDDPDAAWVGVGSYVPTALLVESGVEAYNGVQTYPPEEMWDEIDPDGDEEQIWNRLANVNWRPGVGEPDAENPQRDQILLTFDGCSDFAREHVGYVLSDVALDESCLTTVDDTRQGASRLWIYAVDR